MPDATAIATYERVTQRSTDLADDDRERHAVRPAPDGGHVDPHPPGVVLQTVWRRSATLQEGRFVVRQLGLLVMTAGAMVQRDATPAARQGELGSDVDTEHGHEAA